jgi:endoglucanase
MRSTVTKLLRLAALLAPLAILPGQAAAQTGYWHTSGNKILDASGNQVRIAGINWYGFETSNEVPHGLWTRDYKAMLNEIKAMGFNTVRIPYSTQMIHSTTIPNISFYNAGPMNMDLQNLTPIQVMDAIVAYCGQIGLKVFLDNHRSEDGNSAEANGLWYTSAYPESQWIADWQMLANRYLGNTTVIAMDLRNEPHLYVNGTSTGACWGCGNTATDWQLAAQRAGNAILSVNPNLLIIVEGNDSYANVGSWWAGQLRGVATQPVVLSVANRIVYSPHDYGPTEFQQSWFNSSTTQASLEAVWEANWGYIDTQGIAPLLVGEFGTPNSASDVSSTAAGSQGQWFSGLVAYLKKRPTINWTYWALNGNDRYGLYDGSFAGVALPAKLTLLQTIQAPFGTPNPPTTFTLTVAKSGTGSGTVTSTPAGVSCGATCSASFNSGTVVTLSAAAASGSTFAGWSGGCTGTAPTCAVTMSAAQSVTATFNPPVVTNYTLTVAKAGTGSGTVTSSVGGISCGTACSASLASGTAVTLTAAAASGSTFAGWSGACTGTGTCLVTMTANQSVTATFSPVSTSYTLTVAKAGTGSGTVTSSVGGISCGATCSASIASGTAVTLTAAAASGSAFAGWSGGCTGTAATCTVTMTANQSVTATFNPVATSYTLTVATAGTGSGTVTSSVGGISCGATCSASIASGTAVTLTAAAASGSTFGGWSGACTGTAATCTVTMTANQSVTATFTGTTSTPCANPVTFTSQSGNFNTTGAICLRTSNTVSGWGCSNFDGRTVSVNGGTATGTCGAGPFPLAKYTDGYTYFSVTAGTYPWASLYSW